MAEQSASRPERLPQPARKSPRITNAIAVLVSGIVGAVVGLCGNVSVAYISRPARIPESPDPLSPSCSELPTSGGTESGTRGRRSHEPSRRRGPCPSGTRIPGSTSRTGLPAARPSTSPPHGRLRLRKPGRILPDAWNSHCRPQSEGPHRKIPRGVRSSS